MHTGVREWCLDWYGPYPMAEQTDPVGPEHGLTKVVRGGGLQGDDDRWARSFSRCAIAPSFSIMKAAYADELPDLEEGQFNEGLIGTHYANPDFTRAAKITILDGGDKDWGGINFEHDWSDRFIGYIEGPVTGDVTFTAQADSGVTLTIDDREVLSGRTEEAPRSGTIAMVKGRKYPVTLSYYQDQVPENIGPSYLRLYWGWAGQERVIVPGEALSYGAAELKAAKKGIPKPGRPPGHHNIGFRVVLGEMPKTKPVRCEAPFARQCVKQTGREVAIGPDRDKPYFRKRYLLPVPPDNSSREEIDAAGLHPSFRRHNHSPALEVCPNGDVLMIIYTSYHEYEPEVSLMGTRLRFGADLWDTPSYMFDFVGVNDHAPLLWKDKGILYLFWGNPDLESAYPSQWTTSKDNGASWSEVKFPHFTGRI